MTGNQQDFDGIALEWEDFYWNGHLGMDYPNFLRETDLQIQTKDEEEVPPHSLQLDAWKSLLASHEEFKEKILEALFQYYCKMRPRYEQMGREWIENMPVIESKDEIEKMINLNYVDLSWPYDGDEVVIGFSFGCNWDREHGAGVAFKQGEVTDVGGADCII